MQNMSKLLLEDIRILGENKEEILQIDKLVIKNNEKIGIRGPSGAGKSTFLHLISGLVKPNRGKVLWGNIDIAKLSESKTDTFRRENIGMIFQNFYLFEELSAYDNVSIASCFSSNKSIKQNSQIYLEYFNLKELSKRSVDSYSGGERQRIAVARALSTNPNIIIADEPTASLDKINAEILINDLIRISNEKSKLLIVVSHDDELLKKMNTIITIVNGKIEKIKENL